MNLRTSISLVLGVLFGGAAVPASPQSSDRAGGAYFPDVELPTIDGRETLRLSDFEGKRLLLIEFASW